MEPQNFENKSLITTELKVTRDQLEDFRAATLTKSSYPLTFLTRFRQSEFEWLKQLKLDMSAVLHSEQTYEYFGDFQEGEVPIVETKVKSLKSRQGLTLITFQSEMKTQATLKAVSTTLFVIKGKANG